MAKSTSARIAVLGMGPIGLEVALYAKSLGLQVTAYDRGLPGEALRHWGHVQLFTPFGLNHTPLGRKAILEGNDQHTFPADSECITGWQHRESYLEPLAACGALKGCLRPSTEILGVARTGLLKNERPGDPRRSAQPFRLLLRDDKQRETIEEADIVVDCTGTYSRHRWMGDGGIPAAGERAARNLVAYGLEDVMGSRKQIYAGKAVLVVGGGYSAATTIFGLARLVEQHPEMWITWLIRGTVAQPLRRLTNDPFKNRDRLAADVNHLASRTEANVELQTQAVVESIELVGEQGAKVHARVSGKERIWEVDRIIANVGSSPDNDLFRELQVQECRTSLGPQGIADALARQKLTDSGIPPCTGPEALKTTEANFFVIGAKSFGRSSRFFLRHGFGQVRELFTLISGKSDLDLYRSASK
jgi:thioredoxin reductase